MTSGVLDCSFFQTMPMCLQPKLKYLSYHKDSLFKGDRILAKISFFPFSVTRWWSFLGVLSGILRMRRLITVRCSSTVGEWVYFWNAYRWWMFQQYLLRSLFFMCYSQKMNMVIKFKKVLASHCAIINLKWEGDLMRWQNQQLKIE